MGGLRMMACGTRGVGLLSARGARAFTPGGSGDELKNDTDSGESRASGNRTGNKDDDPPPGSCGTAQYCEPQTECYCATIPGCEWVTYEEVNEGTDSGRRYTGEPLPCTGHSTAACQAGCETTHDSDSRVVCSGTPLACEAILYSWDCGLQKGCAWR
jgi:hypothetical protein